MGLVKLQRAKLGVSLLEIALRFANEGVHELRLPPNEPLDAGVVLEVHRVVVVADRSGDDQRRARLVDEDGVHFVDDGEDVTSLNALRWRLHHVVAQVVEAELVVRTVRDVAEIGVATLFGARLGVVDTADRQAEIVVDVTHPL